MNSHKKKYPWYLKLKLLDLVWFGNRSWGTMAPLAPPMATLLRTDISNHFPITYAFNLRSSISSENHQRNRYLYKQKINESSISAFKHRLRETSWDSVKGLDILNESYKKFTETITQIYAQRAKSNEQRAKSFTSKPSTKIPLILETL